MSHTHRRRRILPRRTREYGGLLALLPVEPVRLAVLPEDHAIPYIVLTRLTVFITHAALRLREHRIMVVLRCTPVGHQRHLVIHPLPCTHHHHLRAAGLLQRQRQPRREVLCPSALALQRRQSLVLPGPRALCTAPHALLRQQVVDHPVHTPAMANLPAAPHVRVADGPRQETHPKPIDRWNRIRIRGLARWMVVLPRFDLSRWSTPVWWLGDEECPLQRTRGTRKGIRSRIRSGMSRPLLPSAATAQGQS